MSADLLIENIPEDLVERLTVRAAKNCRSLNEEVIAILERVVAAPPTLSVAEAIAKLDRIALTTPDEATAMIRKDRDSR